MRLPPTSAGHKSSHGCKQASKVPAWARKNCSKISDKILVVENLLAKCDKLIIGGGMANTFLAAKGLNMQDSLVEAASIDTAKGMELCWG